MKIIPTNGNLLVQEVEMPKYSSVSHLTVCPKGYIAGEVIDAIDDGAAYLSCNVFFHENYATRLSVRKDDQLVTQYLVKAEDIVALWQD